MKKSLTVAFLLTAVFFLHAQQNQDKEFYGYSKKDWKDLKKDILQDVNYSLVSIAPGVTAKSDSAISNPFSKTQLSVNIFFSIANLNRRVKALNKAKKYINANLNSDSIYYRNARPKEFNVTNLFKPKEWTFDVGVYYGVVTKDISIQYGQVGIYVKPNISLLAFCYVGLGYGLYEDKTHNAPNWALNVGFDFVKLADVLNGQLSADHKHKFDPAFYMRK